MIGLATDNAIGGYRPGRVELRDPAAAEQFRPALAAAGIELVCRETLPELDAAVQRMTEGMLGAPPPPGCFSGEGVTRKHMHRFAEAVNRREADELSGIRMPLVPPYRASRHWSAEGA